MEHFSRPWKPVLYGELVSKENAEYQKGTPFERCGVCEYMFGHKCKVVAGYITAYQVCKYFQKEYSREDSMGPKRGDD